MRFVEDWKQKSPLIRPSIFCHSPYTCSEKTLAAAKKAATEHERAVPNTCRGNPCKRGKTANPSGGKARCDTLKGSESWTRTRFWFMRSGSTTRISKSSGDTGAAVSHAPESNMKLASGTAPVPKLIESKVPLGLGTDGCASNNTLDLFSAMDVCAKLHKVHALDPTVSSARQVFAMATAGGASSYRSGKSCRFHRDRQASRHGNRGHPKTAPGPGLFAGFPLGLRREGERCRPCVRRWKPRGGKWTNHDLWT